MTVKILFYLLLTLTVLSVSVSAEQVDLLITGGHIITMDKDDHIYSPGYVAIQDGQIVGVGEGDPPFTGNEVIEAEGKAVLPGLINTHTHLPMVLFRGLADDLEIEAWLRKVIFPAEAENMSRDFVATGTRLGLAELIRGGVTTFADMYYYESTIAKETERAGMRAVLGQTLLDFPAPDFKAWKSQVEATKQFAKEWSDNPLITPAVAPHAPYTVSPSHWLEVATLAEQFDIPILTHLAEAPMELEHTRAVYGDRPIPLLESLGLLTPRLVAAHVIYANKSERELLAKRGVGVAHCPESNMKVAVGVSPVPLLIDAGVAVGLGSDGAASNNNLDMWQEMNSAAKLHKMHRLDPTTMPAKRVLAMATREGARALHMETQIGSLENGKAADVILVDLEKPHLKPLYNLYSALVYSARADDVTHTIVAGRLLMNDRELLTIDEQKVFSQVENYQKKLKKDFKE